MSEVKFGTDGWRAIIAKEFTFANIRLVTQGIANYLKNNNVSKKGIVIGYDNRFLSESFAAECARVMAGNGIKVFMSTKAVPTPLAAFAIRACQAGGAIMITASHNPPEYNGIKFIPEYAGPALPEVTNSIEDEVKRIQEGGRIYELDLPEATELDLLINIDASGDYITHLTKIINSQVFQGKALKVAVDPMYGSGAGYLDRILNDWGCEVRTINNYRDPLFGGSIPEPTDARLSDLKRAVINYQFDLGLALDADGDRFGVIDGNGEFMGSNRLACLLLEYFLNTRTVRGPVCRSVSTTHNLDRIARQNGLAVIETKVGFKYISKSLRENGCIMGVEESGGLSIIGHVPEKDGILVGLLAAEMLAATGKTFDKLSQEIDDKYGMMVNERVDIKITPQEKGRLLADLTEYQPKSIAATAVDTIDATDGKKIILEDGSWILIRASQTEPVIRVFTEAADKSRMAEMRLEVMTALSLTVK